MCRIGRYSFNLLFKRRKNMTNLKASQLFPRASFVGFDHLLDELDFVARHTKDNYPPHNIVKRSSTEYSIELALTDSRNPIWI